MNANFPRQNLMYTAAVLKGDGTCRVIYAIDGDVHGFTSAWASLHLAACLGVWPGGVEFPLLTRYGGRCGLLCRAGTRDFWSWLWCWLG